MEKCVGLACKGKEAGKLSAQSSSPIQCGNRDLELGWVDAEKVEKIQKGSNLITNGTTPKGDYLIKEKEVECPISVSRSGITKPSQTTGESLRQALNPKEQVGKVEPAVDVGYPLQSATSAQQQVVTLGDSTEGSTIRPIGPVEDTPTEVSSIERIPSHTIELSGMIHQRPLRVLLDSGSTSNYISDQVACAFN